MTLAAGDLRHRVLIQRKQVTQATDGTMIEDWIFVAQVWAQIVPSSAREFVAAAAEQSEVRGRMVIRKRDDVDAECRVVYRNQWFGILGVMADPVSGLEYQTLMVSEGARLEQ